MTGRALRCPCLLAVACVPSLAGLWKLCGTSNLVSRPLASRVLSSTTHCSSATSCCVQAEHHPAAPLCYTLTGAIRYSLCISSQQVQVGSYSHSRSWLEHTADANSHRIGAILRKQILARFVMCQEVGVRAAPCRPSAAPFALGCLAGMSLQQWAREQLLHRVKLLGGMHRQYTIRTLLRLRLLRHKAHQLQ